ncbi:MAG: GTP pyrophosphokinase family protein [Dorea sp.]|nr:GTP pyrophosphokinase family protein [Dorea sp.]
MEKTIKNYENADRWKTIMFLYKAALKEMETKMAILNDELQHVHKYNPIEHIKTRIKSPESILKKLEKYGYEASIDNIVKYCNDIAGLRVICSFSSDIYRLAEMIGNQSDIKVIAVKDYIKNPKPSGYKSYHMIIEVPVHTSNSVADARVEIQIRTIAMDFWASLEHKIYYKFEGHAPEYISRDLVECADMVSRLDDRMLQLNEAVQQTLVQNGEQDVDNTLEEYDYETARFLEQLH